ncbi:MAG: hypothetical protein KatS3mg023_3710 [Armatimonadota bacterium]|nr:MAG: hypothetical protein KatS3mg023_3710 [Armatimonadota bacterium]
MSTFRDVVQSYVKALYQRQFGLYGDQLPSLYVLTYGMLRYMAANGTYAPDTEVQVRDVEPFSFMDAFACRAVFARLANQAIGQVSLDYNAPDLMSDADPAQYSVAAGDILPPPPEYSRLLTVPVYWVTVNLPLGDV